MTVRIGKLNGKNLNYLDHDASALDYTLVHQGIIEGMQVVNGFVETGRAIIAVKRTNTTPHQNFMVHAEITARESINTSGTKKIWIEVNKQYINDGMLAKNTNGEGIARIMLGTAYPWEETFFLPLASVADWRIIDERKFIAGKDIFRRGFGSDGVVMVENGEEKVVSVNESIATQTDKMLVSDTSGNKKWAPIENLKSLVGSEIAEEYEVVEAPNLSSSQKTFNESSLENIGVAYSWSGTREPQNLDKLARSQSGHVYQLLYASDSGNRLERDEIVKLRFTDEMWISSFKTESRMNSRSRLRVVIDGEEMWEYSGSTAINLSFSLRKVTEIRFEFYLDSNDMYREQVGLVGKFLFSGKVQKNNLLAFSKIGGGEYLWPFKINNGSSNSGGFSNMGIIVQFPMDVKLKRVKTVNSASSTQARILVVDHENNSQVGELTGGSQYSSTFKPSNPLTLTKNKKYRIIVNNSENFWRKNQYLELNDYNTQLRFGGFLVAGYSGTREDQNRIYDIMSFTIDAPTVLVPSKADIYRYNFVGMIENPIVGQRVKMTLLDGKILSGFKRLAENQYYYLSNIPGLISASPWTMKYPIGYAVSENAMKITIEGSPLLKTSRVDAFVGLGGMIKTDRNTSSFSPKPALIEISRFQSAYSGSSDPNFNTYLTERGKIYFCPGAYNFYY